MCNLFTLLSLILSLKLYKRATFNEKPSYEATMVNKLFPMAKKTISIVQCLSKQAVSLFVICTREKKGTNGVAMSVYRQAIQPVELFPRSVVSRQIGRYTPEHVSREGHRQKDSHTAQLALEPAWQYYLSSTYTFSLVNEPQSPGNKWS